jgi:hypothetical protein
MVRPSAGLNRLCRLEQGIYSRESCESQQFIAQRHSARLKPLLSTIKSCGLWFALQPV